MSLDEVLWWPQALSSTKSESLKVCLTSLHIMSTTRCVCLTLTLSNVGTQHREQERKNEEFVLVHGNYGGMFRLQWLTQLGTYHINHVGVGQVCLHSNIVN